MPVTDCRSLYDATRRLAASLTEKRVMIDIASTREACGGGTAGSSCMREQKADGLTKKDVKLREIIAEFVNQPYVHLVKIDDEKGLTTAI
eukprot:578434-Heterocapsa_arctica.AAC.1